MKDCKYCDFVELNNKWGYSTKTMDVSKNLEVGITKYGLVFGLYGYSLSDEVDDYEDGESFKINFCPMCGRDLES